MFFENIVKQIFDMIVFFRSRLWGNFAGGVVGSDGSLTEFFITGLVFVGRNALHADV